MTPIRGITDVATLLETRAVSPVDLVRGCLSRIESRRELNAFITVLADSALDAARQAEEDIMRGDYRGPLHGVPISVKDLIDVEGVETTSGSAVPAYRARRDASLVARLRDAGAIIIGKTNLHEFAFGTTGDETAFGRVGHPLDATRSAGGSSSGAAVAIVEGMCFGSIGTDTGGSIRIPSAACGIVGLKPGFGEVSCEGIVPLSPTLDHAGPMARTVADAGLMFRVLRGLPPLVPTPSNRALTFGVPVPYFLDRLDPGVRAAFSRTRAALEAGGHAVAEISIDHAASTADAYLHIVLPEAAAFHAPTLESCPQRYSPGVRLRLEMGRYVLAEDYVRAMTMRERLREAVDRAFDGLDAMLLPGLAITAPPLGAASVEVDGKPEPVRAIMLRLTQLFNITGHPAIVLPAGVSNGWPVSVQLVGRLGATDALLDLVAAVEPYITAGPGSVGGGTG